MRYMLLVYTQEDALASSSQEERQQLMNDHWAVIQESRAKGVLEAAEPLAKTSTATTVRLQGSNPIITDGPFAETKEQLAGYYIMDCKDLDEAIGWAAKIPTSCGGQKGCRRGGQCGPARYCCGRTGTILSRSGSSLREPG